MPIQSVNDFVVRFANVNGSGSASANELFARSVMRMGVPVSPRNIFPSNIQGLPTWYEVRVTEKGWLGRRGGVDLMVAMNPQTWESDIAEIEPGGYLLYDSSKPLPPARFRDDIYVLGDQVKGWYSVDERSAGVHRGEHEREIAVKERGPEDEYAKAGIPMLPVVRGEDETRRQILLYTVLLYAVTQLPFCAGGLGIAYLVPSMLLGAGFIYCSTKLLRTADRRWALRTYLFSLAYLALLFLAMAIDAHI